MNERKRPHYLAALLVILIMAMMIASYVMIFFMQNKPDPNLIINGVYVENIDIGGMTAEQAQSVIDNFASGRINRNLYIDVSGNMVETPMSELEYRLEENDVVEQAMRLGKDGDLFSNFREVKRIEEEHVNYSLTFTYSEAKLTKFVKKKCGKKTKKPVDATVRLEDDTIKYTKAKTGLSVDVDATVAAVREQIDNTPTGDISAVAITTVKEPAVTDEMARRCKDKIGSFSTEYTSSNVTRSKNLANAARLINGSVVMPGETFSVHDTISPLTEENGYYSAPSYSKGEVVDSIGGGVCQVSTTLYNAVLRAELEIVARYPHSMVVSYVKPSMDAAIAGDYKDFKFRNDSEVPILIRGEAGGGTIWFTVYGAETRSPDRTVEFVSEVLKTIEPGEDIVTFDPTKPPTYMQVTQSAHIGYEAVLWKIVTENGETTKKQINTSSYKAVPRYVTKGSGEPVATKKPAKTDETEDEPETEEEPSEDEQTE
ncbi:MAG: VanW family protein [Eubacterium sp.]|nr:VanW family protein [Eubacterium sp.]